MAPGSPEPRSADAKDISEEQRVKLDCNSTLSKRPAQPRAVIAAVACLVMCNSIATAFESSGLVGTWPGSHAALLAAPISTSIPQSQANTEAKSHTLVITADTIELQTAAGAASYPYAVLEETETNLTLQTALGTTSGTTEQPLLITWIDADTIQLRLANAPYEIVFTRAP